MTREWAFDGPFSLKGALQERLRAGLPTPEDGRWVMGPERMKGATDAAVLIAFTDVSGPPEVILTARREDLAHHPGQVSFPGGRVDPGDRDREHTALREAEEEIGLPATSFEVLGQMPDFYIPTGYRVVPVVAWVVAPVNFVADPLEVAQIFTVPARLALDLKTWKEETVERFGQRHRTVSMDFEGRRIWGATAGMLRELALALA